MFCFYVFFAIKIYQELIYILIYDLIEISEPLEFRASLQDRKTVRLSWKVPKNLRDSRIEFWFVLRSKKAGDSVYTG